MNDESKADAGQGPSVVGYLRVAHVSFEALQLPKLPGNWVLDHVEVTVRNGVREAVAVWRDDQKIAGIG